MNIKSGALYLIIFVLAGLILFSVLGGREGFDTPQGPQRPREGGSGVSTASSTPYDGYNHFSGTSSGLTPGTTFYGQQGGEATVVTSTEGTPTLQLTLPNGTPLTLSAKTPEKNPLTTPAYQAKKEGYTTMYNTSITTFYGPNGEKATVVEGKNGQRTIVVTMPGTNEKYTYVVSGNVAEPGITSTQYYGSTGSTSQFYGIPNYGSAGYSEGVNGSVGYVTGPQGNTVAAATGPQGNTVVAGSGGGYGNTYFDTLPAGVPRSQIPPGQEDMYILKSEIVPPVCPRCEPVVVKSSDDKQCGPCPSCPRCPDLASQVSCKLVPSYKNLDNGQVPVPVLNDFSTFGM